MRKVWMSASSNLMLIKFYNNSPNYSRLNKEDKVHNYWLGPLNKHNKNKGHSKVICFNRNNNK